MRRLGIALVLASLGALPVLAAAPVVAQPVTGGTPPAAGPASPPATPEPGEGAAAPSQPAAIVHYQRGRAHYATGRYRAAAIELERAFTLDPSGTNLLHDLGMVYERMGDMDRALVAYRRYRDRVDDPAERARADRILTRLRGARTELAEIGRHHGRADALFWVTLGIGLAGLGTGVTVLATADGTGPSATAGVALTAGGVALGLFSLVLYFARDAAPPPPPRLALAPLSPEGRPGLSLALAF